MGGGQGPPVQGRGGDCQGPAGLAVPWLCHGPALEPQHWLPSGHAQQGLRRPEGAAGDDDQRAEMECLLPVADQPLWLGGASGQELSRPDPGRGGLIIR